MNESFDEIAIYFSDLSEEAQKELLKHFGITDPVERNWDENPIAVIYK